MQDNDDINNNKINKSIFLVVIIVFALLLLYSISEFFTAFLGSIMFYVLFKPYMKFLVRKKKWNKSRAALLIVLISFFIILLPVLLFSGMLFNKISELVSQPDLILKYITQLQVRLNIVLLNEKNMAEIQSRLASIVPSILNMGLSLFSSLAMMYFFMYFLLINFNRLEASIILLLPFEKRKIFLFGSELKSQTFSNAIGIPLIAVVQGLSAFFIYYIADVPEAAFWGILTGFASIIPIVGTGIIWLPICIFVFASGNTWQGFLVLAWSALVMGSADNVIRFILAKRMADVHPVVTVLGVIIGLNYMGIPGLIFGPLLISYFIILVKIYYSKYRHVPSTELGEESTLEVGIPFIFQKKFTQKK